MRTRWIPNWRRRSHSSRWVATADFNGDGKLDLATADGQGTSSNVGNCELSIMLGNGNGTFGGEPLGQCRDRVHRGAGIALIGKNL